MIALPEFDQISVISDLHMGGPTGFQIFGQADLLAAYIRHLAKSPSGASALVINGDMVDFLADPDAAYFDPDGAPQKLDRIVDQKEFKPVFEALADYVRTPRRQLVITLGNHDLELALPWVEKHLLDLLSGGDAAPRTRITCAFEGTGFACKVGGAQVLCVHGNEVDTWNATDYETLRRIACDSVQGRTPPEWIPNAGTKLVIEVMNDVKRKTAFVDLLKPEKEGAVRILLALKPELRSKLKAVAEVAAKLTWDGVRRRIGLLSDEEDGAQDGAPGEDALTRIAGRTHAAVDAEKLLNRTEAMFQQRTDPLDLVYGQGSQRLGWWDAMVAVVRQREPYEVAWEAVKELSDDTSFDVRQADSDFERIDALAGPLMDFVIAGHTHLARVVGRSKGKGLYFNSGTWASLMQLKNEQLKSPDAFKPVFNRLSKAASIPELGNLVMRRPTAVTVIKGGAGARASLDEVTLVKGKIVLKPLGGV
jgi:UDP-2,3-diacylglucosamine pyrophosphatase LpxH